MSKTLSVFIEDFVYGGESEAQKNPKVKARRKKIMTNTQAWDYAVA